MPGIDELMRQVQAKESAARARVEGLRAELERITAELAAEEGSLAGWTTTREHVMLLRSEQNGAGPLESAEGVVGEVVGVLSVDDQAVVEALTRAGQGMRAKELCEAVGLVVDHRRVETLRARLKRLVKRSVLVENAGLFDLAEGVRTADPD
ncbi:hypothetical protein JIX56_00205 [Streptomyces sp. CA-210063]|uniref:hypothetical protein n=1 Tax=Streptomyces sp. CA-210063 TaxID=2801029 RepID=UPI00214BF804|nr:hypothetical protein [Streptomyces sp. CA-210063]UUU28471.1 hypothetical protein JIX56_00205 [Streptomyces sp. CA-210063]